MHELAIAESIAKVVAARAVACDAARVTEVRLRIGAASGIVGESLRFSFALLAETDPLLTDARLIIEEVPHRAFCARCDAPFDVMEYIARCPTCGEWSGDVFSGTELRVVDMLVEPRQPDRPEADPTAQSAEPAEERWQCIQ